jgi:creatinine amidohydrolase/Fe(II)-dependent formamide hydrolase-like protein
MKSILALICFAIPPAAAAAGPPSVFIEELTSPEVRDAIAAGAHTAIYYAGSTEQNGPHMVTGKHNTIARHVAGQIAARLGNALVYPVMPFAPTGDAVTKTGHMRFPGSITVSDETFAAVARDVATSARAAGFSHVVLMGDHGGGQKALEKVAADLDREWAGKGPRVHYVPDVYFGAEKRVREYLEARGLPTGAHAGIPDTSQLLFLDERSIRRDRMQPGNPDNGVDGDPRQASAELGRVFIEFKVEAVVARIRKLTSAGG